MSDLSICSGPFTISTFLTIFDVEATAGVATEVDPDIDIFDRKVFLMISVPFLILSLTDLSKLYLLVSPEETDDALDAEDVLDTVMTLKIYQDYNGNEEIKEMQVKTILP